VSGLTRRFGGILALSDVTLDVREGELRGLIGPNGSGKSTFFAVVSGMRRPDAGTIRFADTQIEHMAPYRRQQLGLARTFQEIQLFHELTVAENLLIGAHRLGRAGIAGALLRPPRVRAEEKRLRETARAVLDRLGLASLADRPARSISYGQQRLVEIARALASTPRMLMLDEPAAGLNPAETAALMEQIGRICADGVTILLVEHNMHMIMSLCKRIAVLDRGQVIADGEPAAIQRDAQVIAAYLGPAA
jgi:branched-chain amino acid transport system ATP-binding protein